jgi:hypothetical protein
MLHYERCTSCTEPLCFGFACNADECQPKFQARLHIPYAIANVPDTVIRLNVVPAPGKLDRASNDRCTVRTVISRGHRYADVFDAGYAKLEQCRLTPAARRNGNVISHALQRLQHVSGTFQGCEQIR